MIWIYLRAFYGSIIWNAILYVASEDAHEKAGKEFDWKTYLHHNASNFILVSMFAPVLVWHLDDVVSLINEFILMKFWSVQIPVLKFYYLGAGPLSELVVYLVLKMIGKKKTLLPDPKESPSK